MPRPPACTTVAAARRGLAIGEAWRRGDGTPESNIARSASTSVSSESRLEAGTPVGGSGGGDGCAGGAASSFGAATSGLVATDTMVWSGTASGEASPAEADRRRLPGTRAAGSERRAAGELVLDEAFGPSRALLSLVGLWLALARLLARLPPSSPDLRLLLSIVLALPPALLRTRPFLGSAATARFAAGPRFCFREASRGVVALGVDALSVAALGAVVLGVLALGVAGRGLAALLGLAARGVPPVGRSIQEESRRRHLFGRGFSS